MEEKFGEDVVVEYWYGMILIRLFDDEQVTQCFIEHLTDFYSKKLSEVSSSKRSYIQKMLYMLNSEKTIQYQIFCIAYF
jgi:transcription initiation factor IIE alpha subunit